MQFKRSLSAEKTRQIGDNGAVLDQVKKRQEWSIGIYVGPSPLDLASPRSVLNPVLTREHIWDIPASFVADPFMIKVNQVWYMFFEVMNQWSRKGEIGLATSQDGLKWTYQRIVLAEPYHLSYPYVFEWRNEYYMIPESHMAGSVRLYKASDFPLKWTFAGTLLTGPYYVDSSIIQFDNRWWLFTDASSPVRHDTLRLFWAKSFTGLWFEHTRSPIVAGNPHIARPAGRVLVLGDKVIRYTQDCYPTYGTQVRAFEITGLATTTYQEREIGDKPILIASGVGWNESGMHHIDPHPLEDGRWTACVDGFCWVRPGTGC